MNEIKKRYSLVLEPTKIARIKEMAKAMSKPGAVVTSSEILRRGADTMLADFEEGKFE